MRALLMDAGNTRVTCAAWDGPDQLPACGSGPDGKLVPPVPLFDLGALELPGPGGAASFRDGFRQMHRECGEPPVVMVTVVPEIRTHLPDDLDLTVVDHTSDLPFSLEVREPAQVGPDRLCNVASAAAAGLRNALVVDAGTATTFDLLLDGVFVGGLIAPGLASAAAGLAERTARLDPVPFGPAGWDVGRDTAEAMRAGTWHTGTGGIAHTIDGLLNRYGDLPVILTGGLGVHLQGSDRFFDPQWTLRGAAFLSKI